MCDEITLREIAEKGIEAAVTKALAKIENDLYLKICNSKDYKDYLELSRQAFHQAIIKKKQELKREVK